MAVLWQADRIISTATSKKCEKTKSSRSTGSKVRTVAEAEPKQPADLPNRNRYNCFDNRRSYKEAHHNVHGLLER